MNPRAAPLNLRSSMFCLHVCMVHHLQYLVSMETGEDIRCLGTGVTGGYEPWVLGTQPEILCKSSQGLNLWTLWLLSTGRSKDTLFTSLTTHP